MRHYPRHGPTALLLAAFVVMIASAEARSIAAPQSSSAPVPLAEQLKRIEADLYAGGANAKEDIRELTAILAANPSLAEAHMLLGVAYRVADSTDMAGEARAEFRQALDLKPDLLPARLFLAQVYLEASRPDKAREELEAGLERAPQQTQFLVLLAEAERQLGHLQRSVEISRQVLQIDPKLSQAHYYLGRALLDLKQRDEGIRELELVVQSGVGEPNVYVALGGACLEAGRVNLAITVLEQGVQITPSLPDLHIMLARAYRTRGSLDLADQQLTLVAQAGFSKQPTPALQQLQVSFHVESGLVRLQRGQLVQAAAAFQDALRMDPNSGPAHRYLAEVLMRQGSYRLALGHAVQAEKLGSPLPAAQRKELDAKLLVKKMGSLE